MTWRPLLGPIVVLCTLMVVLAGLLVLSGAAQAATDEEEPCPAWTFLVILAGHDWRFGDDVATAAEAEAALAAFVAADGRAVLAQTVYCQREDGYPILSLEDGSIRLALADLPPEWRIKRRHITVVDCDSGRFGSDVAPLCRDGWQGWVWHDQARMWLNRTAIGPWGDWYGIVIHEAVHIVHANYCLRYDRDRAIPRPLFRELWRLYKEYRGGPAIYLSGACVPDWRHWVNDQDAIWKRWYALPADNRPVDPYGLSNFWEYTAVTITAWYTDRDHLERSDPRAYAAIAEHGLAVTDD